MSDAGQAIAALVKCPEFFEDVCWGGVLGFSRYLISSEGRVISIVKRKPRVLSPIAMGLYRGLQLSNDSGVIQKRYVHRLVLEAWEGPPTPGDEARHLNGNRLDNRLANLAWGTRAENHADKVLHGTANRGERNPLARLTAARVLDMRRLYAEGGWTFKSLAKRFGVTAMTAHRAVRRQSWTEI